MFKNICTKLLNLEELTKTKLKIASHPSIRLLAQHKQAMPLPLLCEWLTSWLPGCLARQAFTLWLQCGPRGVQVANDEK